MRWIVILFFLSLPTAGWAADFICTRVVLGRTLYGLVRSQDDSAPAVQGCLKVAKANAVAQRALEETVIPKYRKLVNNLMEEMTAEEKTVADVPTAEETVAEAKQTELTEITTDAACTATRAQIINRLTNDAADIQTDIDAVTNIATAKTALTTMKTKTLALLLKLAECLLARTGGLQ